MKRLKKIRAMRSAVPAVSAGPATVPPKILDGFDFEVANYVGTATPPGPKPGRPRKPPTPKRPRGRQVVWTEDARRLLLNYVSQYKIDHPNTSDTAALRNYRSDLAQQKGVHGRNPKLPALKTLKNNLIVAKHLVPKNLDKFEK